MFIVTNRRVREGKGGPEFLGTVCNEEGPNELRIVQATKAQRRWQLEVLPDVITSQMKRSAGLTGPEFKDRPVYASTYAANRIVAEARKTNRNIFLFVHGYNNDIPQILKRASDIAKTYDVIVVPFSWPAHGGGARGVLQYRQDKQDARASATAFLRTLIRARQHIDRLNQGALEDAISKVSEKHRDDSETRNRLIAERLDAACPFHVSMMLHSMGNYLFQCAFDENDAEQLGVLFDNVVMVAADVNNADHADWVGKIRFRENLYIVINENDRALGLSERKVGELQGARLGRVRRGLDAREATYVDATDAPSVGHDHAYFEGAPVKNARGALHRFFRLAFNGQVAHEHLDYDAALNAFRVATRRAARSGTAGARR